jgi:hypothetical protein
VLIDRNDLLKHLLGIPDLDLSADLYAEPLAGPRFRLGACSSGPGRDRQGVENVVYRKPLTNYAAANDADFVGSIVSIRVPLQPVCSNFE